MSRFLQSVALIATSVVLAGCTDQDASRISKVSGKALKRAERLTGEAGEQLGINVPKVEKQVEQKLDVVKPDTDGQDVSQRVQTRLKWDDLLEGLTIRVRAEKGVITLSGKVRNEMQRRRALVLTESTKGVDRVVDAMELDVSERK
jgi:osmotically-inducible protein OsmY